jgi:hypothetical protein
LIPVTEVSDRRSRRATANARTARLFNLLRRGQKSFTLQLLAGQLAGAADGFSLFAGLLDRRLFISVAEFHLTENAFTLHLLFENFQGLINIVVTNDDLQANTSVFEWL